MKKIVILFIALLIALAVAIPSVAYAEKGPPFTPEPPPGVRPIVFIHGAAGSALQFHSQYLRFATNGWPVSHLFAFEWTGAFPSPETSAERTIRLDAFIDSVLDDTGADQVYLLGHSAGTAVSFAYLADSARAAKVAKYVNLDGATASAPPGGVPTLAIWAELAAPGVPNPPREIIGATNVVIVGQYHVGLVSCAETFAWIYEFFTGEPPATTDILPEPPGQVEIAGRAVFFPENTGVGDATLEIWEVDGDTGFRVYDEPTATCTLSGNWYYDGAWGPVKVNGLKHYEIVLLREGYRAHHFYFEPFMRSDYFIRLMTSAPGGIGELLDTSDNHTNLTITRDKRFLSDPTSDNDILEINGVNVLEALYPLDIRVVAMFVYDWHADGVSDLTQPIPFLHAIHNFSGIDLYMPAADPPDGTISIVLTPGDGDGKTQVVNVPNWASSGHAISIRFNDYVQEIDSWTEYVPKQAPGQ